MAVREANKRSEAAKRRAAAEREARRAQDAEWIAAGLDPKEERRRQSAEVSDGTRVYCYGVIDWPRGGRRFGPGESRDSMTEADMLHEACFDSHAYRNKLVEVELERRREVAEAVARMSPAVLALEAEIGESPTKADRESGARASEGSGVLGELAAVEAGARMERVKARGRPKLDDARIKELRARLKSLRECLKSAREEMYATPEWAAWQAAAHDRHLERMRKAYADFGRLHWWTKIVAAETAAKFKRGAPPRFRPWKERKIRLAVVYKKGSSAGCLFEPGSHVRVELDTERERLCNGCLARRRHERRGTVAPVASAVCQCSELPPPSGKRLATVHWPLGRVESDDDGGSKRERWIKLRINYAREIPADSEIVRAFLVRREVGGRDRWSLQFVLRRASWVPGDQAAKGAVGIDLGWRRMKDGRLRVATYSGTDGHEGELSIPPEWIEEHARVERIRAARDRLFDFARPLVAEAFRGAEGLSERDQKVAKSLHLWKSPQSMSAWVGRMMAAGVTLDGRIAAWWEWENRDMKLRFGGGGKRATFAALIRAWRSREAHLHSYESNLRDQLQANRRDRYRAFAATIARRYSTVVLEDMDLRKFHQLPRVEDGMTPDDDVARMYVRHACLSALRSAIAGRVREVRRVNRAGTTSTCHACGHKAESADSSAKLMLKCPGCERVHDRDVNAARNILSAIGEVVDKKREALAPVSAWSYADCVRPG